MPELGPLGVHPVDKGIGAFPTFPSFSLANLDKLSDGDPLTWLIDQNTSPGEGGPGGPSNAGSTSSGMGVPGVGPTDGTTTGIGNLSGSQAASAFGSGLLSGLPGVGLGNNIASAINNGSLAPGQLGQMGLQGLNLALSIANPNPVSMGLKGLLNGLVNMANAAQNSTGFRPPTFAEAMKEFTQNLKDMSLKSFFGLQEPNLEFTVPDTVEPDLIGNVPTGNSSNNPDSPVGVSDTGGNPSGDPSDF